MCYKALLLLEHLIKHGPGKVVGDVQSSAAVLDRLQHFEFKDGNMRDHGGWLAKVAAAKVAGACAVAREVMAIL